MKLGKKGIRALGIAESFIKKGDKSILAGIVMRGDMHIDGVAIAKISVGGMDATDGIIEIFRSLSREDIHVILLGGCVISWFNIVDVERVCEETRAPVVCVTYDESEGLEKYIREYFADDCEDRIKLYKKLGARERIKLNTGYEVLVRFIGMTKSEARILLNRFTTHGKIPEPIRVARLTARAVLKA